MGSALVLPGSVTSSPLGKFYPYEGIDAGTVFLWDAQYAPMSAIPADAAKVTNLVRDRAAAVSSVAVASCDFEVTNTLNNGSSILASGELTGQKGIHVASPQAGGQVAASALGLSMSAAFANWLLSQTDAGADYVVLASLWLRCTRDRVAGSANPQSLSHINNSTSAVTNRLYHMAVNGPASGVAVSTNQAPPAVGAAGLACVSSQGWNGTKPANLNTTGQRRVAVLGATDAWSSFNWNLAPSFILYRAQLDLIDLSEISGADRVAKCTARIAALNAMATRDFATGGRFYGDTFTAAATLKP